MICSYLLNGYDVIRILKLCIEERSEAEKINEKKIKSLENKYKVVDLPVQKLLNDMILD